MEGLRIRGNGGGAGFLAVGVLEDIDGVIVGDGGGGADLEGGVGGDGLVDGRWRW